ncbi:MAG: SLOG family protein [Candidatus Thalassarchaeaceae archaeon]|nr:SLOG family protein [Candidatus Thalassarchaeaceae archaeon]
MANEAGRDVIGRLGGKDLNQDGRIINLVVVGSSRFYDYSVIEEAMDEWTNEEAHPDLVITGGASGVDYLAERWADNNNIAFAVFSEEWNTQRAGLEDGGRVAAPTSLTHRLLETATHVLAFPSPTSKWTNVVVEMAEAAGIPVKVVKIE